MAWWKTLFETETAAMKAAAKEQAEAEMKAYNTMYKASPKTYKGSSTGWTVSPTFPPAEINGVDLDLLMELAKMAKGLDLKTAEDVRKHFGEFYGEHYTFTFTTGGICKK